MLSHLQTVRRARLRLAAGCLLLLLCGLLQAQPATDDPAALRPIPVDVAERFDQLLLEISAQKAHIQQLEVRVAASEGQVAEIFSARLDRIWSAMFQKVLRLAREVAGQMADGRDIGLYQGRLVGDLSELPDAAREAIRRLRAKVVFPSAELPPEEYVVADRRLMLLQLELDAIYRGLLDYTEVAAQFGQDVENERQILMGEVAESAANRSAFLELAITDVETVRPAASTLPENADLGAWLLAAEARVNLAARGMQDAVGLMSDLGLDATQYREQLLRVTGEITTDVFDLEIVTGLLSDWTHATVLLIAEDGPQLLFVLLLIVAILVVAYQLGRVAQKLVNRALDSSRVQISNLLRRMILSSVRNLILFLGFLIAISQLGISIGPLLAGFGIAGFIVGFALQDTLGNFASGMLILLYRPFDVGDVVIAGGVEGTVSHMSLVNTTFLTFDNQRLVVPNNLIWGSVITNLTAQATRRIDLVFGISYEDDVDDAQAILTDIVESHPNVLEDPEPMVRVHELGDSSVNFVVRPWVATEDYWETYWALTKAVKVRFDNAGISIPYPQQDVHVIAGDQGGITT